MICSTESEPVKIRRHRVYISGRHAYNLREAIRRDMSSSETASEWLKILFECDDDAARAIWRSYVIITIGEQAWGVGFSFRNQSGYISGMLRIRHVEQTVNDEPFIGLCFEIEEYDE